MEMHMNFKQQIVIVIGVLAIGYSLLIVPWMTYETLDTADGTQLMAKYERRLFNSPPENPLAFRPPEIVWMYSFQQIGLVLAVNALLLFFLRSRKTKNSSAFSSRATAHAAF